MLCLCASNLSGQEFRLISTDNFEQIEALKFFNENGPHKLSLRRYYLNSSKPIPRGNILHLFSVDSETQETSKNPTLSISFKEQKTDSIIFIEKGTSVDQFNYRFIQNDATSFPTLTAAIFNNMEKPVLLKIADTIIKIPPKSQKFIPLPKNKKGYFDEKVVFAAQKKDKSIDYFYSTFWRVYSDSKKLCFVDINEENRHKLTVLSL